MAFSTENLFAEMPVHASSWIDRWSTAEPGVKAERIETGHGLGRLAVDEDAIWVANATSETVTRIERRTALADWRADLDHRPEAIAIGTEAVWVLAENGWLWRFHPDGTSEGVARTGRGARDLVCDAESVWVLQGDGDLAAFDQSTGEMTVEAKIPRGARQILLTDDDLVAVTGGGNRVCRIHKDRGTVVAETKLPADGSCAALDAGTLWVACSRLRSSRWGALVRCRPGDDDPHRGPRTAERAAGDRRRAPSPLGCLRTTGRSAERRGPGRADLRRNEPVGPDRFGPSTTSRSPETS